MLTVDDAARPDPQAPLTIVDPLELQQDVGKLVDAWCDRRSLRALREILAGYPLLSPLTDGWAELLKALESVRAFAPDELTDDEAARVEPLIGAASATVHELGPRRQRASEARPVAADRHFSMVWAPGCEARPIGRDLLYGCHAHLGRPRRETCFARNSGHRNTSSRRRHTYAGANSDLAACASAAA